MLVQAVSKGKEAGIMLKRGICWEMGLCRLFYRLFRPLNGQEWSGLPAVPHSVTDVAVLLFWKDNIYRRGPVGTRE